MKPTSPIAAAPFSKRRHPIVSIYSPGLPVTRPQNLISPHGKQSIPPCSMPLLPEDLRNSGVTSLSSKHRGTLQRRNLATCNNCSKIEGHHMPCTTAFICDMCDLKSTNHEYRLDESSRRRRENMAPGPCARGAGSRQTLYFMNSRF